MYQIRLPMIVAFLAFMLIEGGLAYYCWTVIRRHRERLRDPNLFQPERERSWFTVIVMFLPLFGFSFGCLYFAYKTLETLVNMIFK